LGVFSSVAHQHVERAEKGAKAPKGGRRQPEKCGREINWGPASGLSGLASRKGT
jgi:hypothetical protein